MNLTWHHISFKPISQEVKGKFFQYFAQGHSPSSGKQLHKLNLLSNFEGKILHADRSINPSVQDIYYLFKIWREEQYGKESGEEMFTKLEDIVGQYNKKYSCEGGHAFLQRYISNASTTTSQPLVLAVCTPLMARAHELIR